MTNVTPPPTPPRMPSFIGGQIITNSNSGSPLAAVTQNHSQRLGTSASEESEGRGPPRPNSSDLTALSISLYGDSDSHTRIHPDGNRNSEVIRESAIPRQIRPEPNGAVAGVLHENRHGMVHQSSINHKSRLDKELNPLVKNKRWLASYLRSRFLGSVDFPKPYLAVAGTPTAGYLTPHLIDDGLTVQDPMSFTSSSYTSAESTMFYKKLSPRVRKGETSSGSVHSASGGATDPSGATGGLESNRRGRYGRADSAAGKPLEKEHLRDVLEDNSFFTMERFVNGIVSSALLLVASIDK